LSYTVQRGHRLSDDFGASWGTASCALKPTHTGFAIKTATEERIPDCDRTTDAMTTKIAFVTNEPAPYRIPAWNRMAAAPDVSLHMIFCCQREPNREWSLPPMEFEHTFLRERITTINGRYIHNNPDVIPVLKRLAPDVVITGGFNPTHLYAFAYALVRGVPHVAMTDGTLDSEKALSVFHRMVRHIVYARSRAFISASLGGTKLYESYGIPESRCFTACLCVENSDYFPVREQTEGPFDFIFCGRIEAVKNPFFVLDVARTVAKDLARKVNILFVGGGSLQEEVRKAASMFPDLLEATFNGFALQHELPHLYRSARLFMFPTLWDPWGVVANEACAAGLPVLVSPHAGVAGELVLDGENGFICDLDVRLWADRATLLLTQPETYCDFSERSRSLVSKFTFDHASAGILSACRLALNRSAR
jgi:glycosyltransferase involved in cell wall biosynthesis